MAYDNNIYLDFSAPGEIVPVVYVKQGDIGRTLTFKLYDGGTALSGSSNSFVLQAMKPDGHFVLLDISGTGQILTTQQLTCVVGTVDCEVRWDDGAYSGSSVRTASFKMQVLPSSVEGGDPSASDVAWLNAMLVQMTSAKNTAVTAATNASAAATRAETAASSVAAGMRALYSDWNGTWNTGTAKTVAGFNEYRLFAVRLHGNSCPCIGIRYENSAILGEAEPWRGTDVRLFGINYGNNALYAYTCSLKYTSEDSVCFVDGGYYNHTTGAYTALAIDAIYGIKI